jgi:hypothetical protein
VYIYVLFGWQVAGAYLLWEKNTAAKLVVGGWCWFGVLLVVGADLLEIKIPLAGWWLVVDVDLVREKGSADWWPIDKLEEHDVDCN